MSHPISRFVKSAKKWRPVAFLKRAANPFALMLTFGIFAMAAQAQTFTPPPSYDRSYNSQYERTFTPPPQAQTRQDGRVLGECSVGDALLRSGVGALIGDAFDDQNGGRAGALAGAFSCIGITPNTRGQRYYGDIYSRPDYRYQSQRQRCFNETVYIDRYNRRYMQTKCTTGGGRVTPVGRPFLVGR